MRTPHLCTCKGVGWFAAAASLLEETARARTAHGAQPTPRLPHCPASTAGRALWAEHCGPSTAPGASDSPRGSQAFPCFWPRGLRGSGEGRDGVRRAGPSEGRAPWMSLPGEARVPVCWERSVGCGCWAGPDPVSLPGPLGDLVSLGGSRASHLSSLGRTPLGPHVAQGIGLAAAPGPPPLPAAPPTPPLHGDAISLRNKQHISLIRPQPFLQLPPRGRPSSHPTEHLPALRCSLWLLLSVSPGSPGCARLPWGAPWLSALPAGLPSFRPPLPGHEQTPAAERPPS